MTLLAPKQTKAQRSEFGDSRPILTALFLATAATLFAYSAAAAAVLYSHNTTPAYVMIASSMTLLIGMVWLLRNQQVGREHRMLTAMIAAETARAQAEAISREKSRMLATMSHEIRTPLNGVIGMLGLLEETELSEEQRNYAHTAHSSGRILLSIVDEILDTAKLESKTKTQRAAVDLVALVESVTELLSPRAHAKGIEISSRVALDVPREIQSDELRLRQILFNLAGNAIKFTQKGAIAIEVTRPQNGRLQISVSDTGIGMTQDESLRIFGEYVQANDSTHKNFGGTGLGLAICRKLVEAMGGAIEVTSISGKGSCFTANLPIESQIHHEAPKHPLANRRYALALVPGFTRDHLAKTLQEWGADIYFIETSRELAMQLTTPTPLTQFICSARYSATLRAWAKKQNAHAGPTPIGVWVMLKAEQRKNHVDLLAAPFAGYLLKPVRRSTLLNQLSEYDGKSLKQTGLLLGKAATDRKAKARFNAAPLRTFTILLAEDNMINALLARTFLERVGHKVVIAQDGAAALTALKTSSDFDLALLDVEMPQLSGLAVARAIRHDKAYTDYRNLPLLALTANVRAEDLSECKEAGMNDHLAKPFDRLDLEEKIALLMRGRQAA